MRGNGRGADGRRTGRRSTTPRVGDPRFPRFAGLAVGLTAGVALVGWIPTVRQAGSEALAALLAGCAVSLLAGLAGGWVLLRSERSKVEGGEVERDASQAVVTALRAMGLRLLVLVGLGAAVGFLSAVPSTPFLVWLAISYLILLPLETRYALMDVTKTTTKTDTRHETSELER